MDVVLEVGTGTGALTLRMAQLASAVVAVELDTGMAGLTREAVSGYPNVRILNVDALAGKHTVNPLVLDTCRAGLAVAPDRELKLIANLPYHIATPLISNLLVQADLSLVPVRMVVTIQHELAERLVAAPATSAYSGLSVLVQALADVEIVRALPPSVFWPRPKVDSAIVQIIPNPEKRALVHDLTWFHQVVRRIFLHRRKNLRGVLFAQWRDHWRDKAEVDAFLHEQGLAETGQVRAETLDVEEFLQLAEALKAHGLADAPAEDDVETS